MHILKTIFYFVFFLIVLSSCSNESKCQEEFRANLEYVVRVQQDTVSVHRVKPFSDRVIYLEETSGIESEYSHFYGHKMFVSQSDIENWTNWLKENCQTQE